MTKLEDRAIEAAELIRLMILHQLRQVPEHASHRAEVGVSHHDFMERTFGDKWRKCLAEGRCWIVQDTVYNPWDGNGLTLVCSVHDCKFNIATERGQTNVAQPAVCPRGAKAKLN